MKTHTHTYTSFRVTVCDAIFIVRMKYYCHFYQKTRIRVCACVHPLILLPLEKKKKTPSYLEKRQISRDQYTRMSNERRFISVLSVLQNVLQSVSRWYPCNTKWFRRWCGGTGITSPPRAHTGNRGISGNQLFHFRRARSRFRFINSFSRNFAISAVSLALFRCCEFDSILLSSKCVCVYAESINARANRIREQERIS